MLDHSFLVVALALLGISVCLNIWQWMTLPKPDSEHPAAPVALDSAPAHRARRLVRRMDDVGGRTGEQKHAYALKSLKRTTDLSDGQINTLIEEVLEESK